jgi:hypothetical protein
VTGSELRREPLLPERGGRDRGDAVDVTAFGGR